MGPAQQQDRQGAVDQVGQPGAQPGRQNPVPAQGLTGLHRSVEGEADQDPEPEVQGPAGTPGAGPEGMLGFTTWPKVGGTTTSAATVRVASRAAKRTRSR